MGLPAASSALRVGEGSFSQHLGEGMLLVECRGCQSVGCTHAFIKHESVVKIGFVTLEKGSSWVSVIPSGPSLSNPEGATLA